MQPKDSIKKVQGIASRHEEEEDVVAISHLNVYKCCPWQASYKRKINEGNKCSKGLTEYTETKDNLAVVCDVAVQQNNDIKTLTIYKRK